MTLRGWIILDYLMGTKPSYRYPCKRGERQKALEERRQCGQTSEGWSDGTTSQERLQPRKLQRTMDGFPCGAFRASMALLTPHNVWPRKADSWLLVPRIWGEYSPIVWSHKAVFRNPEQSPSMCTWVNLQLLCWAYQQVWHKTSHKLDRKGHFPWNYGNSDPGSKRRQMSKLWA